MTAIIFQSKRKAGKILERARQKMNKCKAIPVLETVLVGSDLISESYFRSLKRIAKDLRVDLRVKRFDSRVRLEKVTDFLKAETKTEEIDALLPLVSSQSGLFNQREEIVKAIGWTKDSDYLRETVFGDKKKIPSVCRAVLLAIEEAGKELSFVPRWAKILVVGDTGFWGSRIKQTLIARGFENISGANRKTADLISACQTAEVLISCVGRQNLITREMVKKGSAVIDIGFSLIGGQLVGDVNFERVKKRAGFITPVLGGIGPLATALVFDNLIGRFFE
ncbi:MAG: bifunctional 5,10-methylenetetrahydrofolate dehydrogenase/5,10-methenyltetrahydrofolate cyclohydrolase [Candidatus Pacebacteria bacterium]|nr:bifunctional 5,10-methylenetetrahydrofolate dehydrogenase/5,10-methenyltetrahydrofolate cyclohydrolase [Candidatus Paceibacterota bacterium]